MLDRNLFTNPYSDILNFPFVADDIVECLAEVGVAGMLYGRHEIGASAMVTTDDVASHLVTSGAVVDGVGIQNTFFLSDKPIGQFKSGTGRIHSL